MKFRLELDEEEVMNLIGIINVAPMRGQDAEFVAALKAKIGSGTAIVESLPAVGTVEPEAVEAARNGAAEG